MMKRKLVLYLLRKVIRPRECFAAIRTRIRPFLGVGPHMSKNRLVARLETETRRLKKKSENAYRLRCSSLLKSRPQDGMGHE